MTRSAINAARRGVALPGHDPARSNPPTIATRCPQREHASTARVRSSCRPAGDKIRFDRPSPKSRKRGSAAQAGKELAVYRGIDVHQPDGAAELFMPLPHALDLNLPGVSLCSHDLPGKYILGALEAGCGRDRIARTCMRNAGLRDPKTRQYKKPCKVLHWICEQRGDDPVHG